MKTSLVGGLLFVFAIHSFAHRLDEYLQATRIAVTAERIELSIDLTPGVAIANRLLEIIDQDRDQRVSQEEVTVYAQRVLKDVRIQLDGKPLTLSLETASFPLLTEVKKGWGIIQIKATTPIKRLVTGDHALTLTNAHLPAMSVYLVNALAPRDPAVQIRSQIRDDLQKHYRLEFGIVPTGTNREKI